MALEEWGHVNTRQQALVMAAHGYGESPPSILNLCMHSCMSQESVSRPVSHQKDTPIGITEEIMKTLTEPSFKKALEWLFHNGRDLDQARLLFAFGQTEATSVVDELAAYQNPDGGFGHALEADVWLKDSSVIATTVALQILREVQADASHAYVQGAISYLIDTLDRNTLAWDLVPENVDDAPHAPWWDPEDPQTAFTPNPGMEIVSHFHHYAAFVPTALLQELTEAALAYLRVHAEHLGMHDIYCTEWLRTITSFPETVQQEITGSLHAAVNRVVETDSSKWSQYCLRPLSIIDSPESPYYDELRDAVSINLDYLIDTQKEEGSWPVYWSWGENTPYPEAWEKSQKDWQGVQIIENIKRLLAFSRIDFNADGLIAPYPHHL